MKGNPAKHTKDISIAVQFSKDFIKLTHLFDRINVRFDRRKLQECKSLSILLSYRLSQKPKLLGYGKFNHLTAQF